MRRIAVTLHGYSRERAIDVSPILGAPGDCLLMIANLLRQEQRSAVQNENIRALIAPAMCHPL
jgi:hypothetical protein